MSDTPTDRDLEAIANFWHPSHGWCVRADTHAATLARAEAAEAERDEAREAVNRLGRAMGVVPGAAQCFGDVIEEAIKRTALREGEDG